LYQFPTAETVLRTDDHLLRAAGLSSTKLATLRRVADLLAAGTLDESMLEELESHDAAALLRGIKGIGPWTAEIYLMFCSGHPDIFPAGDLALQKAVGHALRMDHIPDAKELVEIAKPWSPHRHAAALLFWKYYAVAIRKAGGIAL